MGARRMLARHIIQMPGSANCVLPTPPIPLCSPQHGNDITVGLVHKHRIHPEAWVWTINRAPSHCAIAALRQTHVRFRSPEIQHNIEPTVIITHIQQQFGDANYNANQRKNINKSRCRPLQQRGTATIQYSVEPASNETCDDTR